MKEPKIQVECPNCDGKGHVLDGGSSLITCLSVVLAPLMFLERNDPDGMTRKECPRCEGDGWIYKKASR